MAKAPISTITSVANDTSLIAELNANFQILSDAIDDSLSRLGESPNSMENDLDMNTNRILNLAAATTSTEPVRLNEFNTITASIAGAAATLAQAQAAADAAEADADAAAASALAADASADAAAASVIEAAAIASGLLPIYIGNSPPGTAQNLWWDNESGYAFVKYNDGNSEQWVPIASPLPEHTHADYASAVDPVFSGTGTFTNIDVSNNAIALQFVGGGVGITGLNASNLGSGTIPDARFPATLPAASGANLTALNATQLTSGTVPNARFPATLPAASGVNLTALNASNLDSGTVPNARFPATLPAASGVNLTALNATQLTSGTIPDARFAAPVTFTPAVSLATPGTSSFSYATQLGRYTKIGRTVWFVIDLTFTPTIGTGTGVVAISLPLTPSFDSTAAIGNMGTNWVWPASRTQIVCRINTSAAITLQGIGAGVAASNFTHSNLTSGSAHSITISGTFNTAS